MRAVWIRLLQFAALHAPSSSMRVWIHRRRGVEIGEDVFIGMDALLETSRPELISIGNRATVSIRATVIAHFRGGTAAERNEPGARFSVCIEDDAFVGPGAIVLPGVTVGEGAVVAAGSVVSSNVEASMMVQGNPARPVAVCGIPLGSKTPLKRFYRHLRPLH